ncbi:D-aminoacid aminotransferase-like PLP-dependent enzyme [Piedraia hortae CBS 480.64]|uniref:D-aminoacid aminotransferase-like PLP-dependent enzyme n=1 Tax=Piedraia hortae CBS 480.64 TaxID=1314780 RepID=A0A6A7C225_9PEZI|nr:D-aminoacid aminotransferase-like PLP-dependent enzyme [Piedraia hortae CBS 480.64]
MYPFVFTTLRWDPALVGARNSALYLFDHHYERLRKASQYCDFPFPHSPLEVLDLITTKINHDQNSPYRVKLKVFETGELTCEVTRVTHVSATGLFPATFPPSVSEPGWTVVPDNGPTRTSLATKFKTADRVCYERARLAAGIHSPSDPREVLLYDRQGLIFDGSIATPYFWRNNCWITPSEAAGGLRGTTRRWALDNGLCIEGCIYIHNCVDGEVIILSNAVRGFYQAVFRRRPE